MTGDRPPLRIAARGVSALVAALGTFVGAADGAGLALRTETREVASPGRVQRAELRIDGRRLRVEALRGPDDPVAAIFRGDRQVVYVLAAAERVYTVLDRATVDAWAGRLADARRALDERLATLPPAERATLARMMDLPPAEPAPRALRPTDRTRRAEGVVCRIVEVWSADELVADLCTVPFGDLDLARLDLRVFRDLADWDRAALAEAAPGLGTALVDQPLELFEELDGFPVEARRLRGERALSVTRFLDVRRAALPDALFEPPDGFAERSVANAPTPRPSPSTGSRAP